MWRLRMLGWALLAFVAAPLPSLACTYALVAIDVGPSFRAEVRNFGHPIEGLEVRLLDEGFQARAITDQNGIARFRNVPPGSYGLDADLEADDGWFGAAVEVHPWGSSDVTVPLEVAIILTRSLKGTLRLPDSVPGQRQSKFSVELLDGVSGRVLDTTTTDENDGFEFPGFPSGLYLLRLSSTRRIGGGMIAVAVRPNAATDDMDIDLGWTGCGLHYVDRGTCPRSELRLGHLAGRAMDTSGGSMPDAEILVFDAADKLVQQTRGDKAGSFNTPPLPDGTYQLVVRWETAFIAWRGTLTIDSESEHSRLDVRLGLGSCSYASVP